MCVFQLDCTGADLSEELQLVDQFPQVFFSGQNVDAIADVVDERGPRDDRKRRQHTSPVRKRVQRCVEDAQRLRQTLPQSATVSEYKV